MTIFTCYNQMLGGKCGRGEQSCGCYVCVFPRRCWYE